MTTGYTEEAHSEIIRALKAAQTVTLQYSLMVAGLFGHPDPLLKEELLDAVKAAHDHAQALGCIIRRLESK